jgi:ArsR family transcriptional regulator
MEVFRLIAAQTDPICVCDIVDRFNVSQPTISHHLKALRDAGLVKVSRRGVWAFYAVDPAGLAILRHAPAELVPADLIPPELAVVS